MEEFIFDLQRFDDTISSGDTTISTGGTYTLANGYAGTITVETSDAVILVGTEGTTLAAQIVTGTTAANLTISGLNLTSTGNPIRFGSGGGTLNLIGDNYLTTSGANSAALNIGGGLTITGTGYLTATATGYGAGVGTDYGEITTANLTVTNGIITATSNYGAGFGSGFQSSIGTIAISGGTVNAISNSGAGIGSGAGTGDLSSAGAIAITGGYVSGTSQDGAGIGSGFGGAIGNISIGGNAGVTAASTGSGAGIGSGSTFGNTSSAGNITINGTATVTATSASYGAGIGSGYAQYGGTNSAGNVTINEDATVTAASLSLGVGLGLGGSDGNSANSIGTITLSGDTSTAAKSMVVIDNSNNTQLTTINSNLVSGARLVFVDGEHVNSSTGTITTTTTANVTEVVYGEDVYGVTNVGKVDGSDDYIYVGGIGVISDYAGVTIGEDGESGAKIRYATDCFGFNFDGETLAINSSTGTLIVQDCKDKLISIADVTGNTTAYVYSPTESGVTYGNLFSPLEVIVGSATGSDYIFAGDGGSTVWGGFGAYDDTLNGGAGRDEFVYIDGGGNDVIANYGGEDVIKVGGSVNGVNLFGNFALNFADGTLTLADSQDRIITVVDGANNVLGQAYYASSAGTVDGSGLVGVEILVGGAFGSNLIIAGDGGSSLWSNFGGVNTLIGGAGADEFFYTPGSGIVFVENADAFDSVNLYGVTSDQIANVAVTATGTTISFTDGGILNVAGNGLLYKIDGENYYADAQTGTLTQT